MRDSLPDLSDPEQVRAALGDPIGPSSWFLIDQDRIDCFGRNTDDVADFHMNPDWARRHSPFGQTVAYGFQTLSMMTAMMNESMPRGSREIYKLNYGFDRVRLIAPVPSGARIRGGGHFADIRIRDEDSHLITVDMKVEVEGVEQPAVIAKWLFMVANAPHVVGARKLSGADR